MPRLDNKYTEKMKQHFLSYASVRRDVIKLSDDALHLAKRAIFAMHRDDMKEADIKLKESETLLAKLQADAKKDPRVTDEGAYRAAVEEYVESMLFLQFLKTGNIGKITSLAIDPESYVAGLCDVPGELYRYAIKAATEKDIAMVKKCADMGQEIAGALIEFNLTSYLRNKFDQAKQAVQKLEQVVYEVSLRN